MAGGIGNAGASARFDVLDPATGEWTALPNVPRAFDHAGFGVAERDFAEFERFSDFTCVVVAA